MSSLKSYTKIKNNFEVLQMTPQDVIDDILTDERYMDFMGICVSRVEVKGENLVADIKNDRNHIHMVLNLKDIAKRYGYTLWKYSELVSWDYSDYGSVRIDHKDRTPMLHFFNTSEVIL